MTDPTPGGIPDGVTADLFFDIEPFQQSIARAMAAVNAWLEQMRIAQALASLMDDKPDAARAVLRSLPDERLAELPAAAAELCAVAGQALAEKRARE